MKSTIKAATKFVVELNQSTDNSSRKEEGIQQVKAHLGQSVKKNMGRQSAAWPVY